MIRIVMTGLLLSLTLGAPMAMAANEPAADDSAQVDQMTATDMSKYKEQLPVSRFVLIAYMVVWAGLFVFLLSIYKRQKHVESELDALREALAKHDASGGTNDA